MNSEEQIKEMVKQQYSNIALQGGLCCGADCCSGIMNDDYSQLDGYNPDADMNLGCGLPTQFAKIKKGDVVIDLGSGAGNDCFVARAETGETGVVIGIDFSEPMIDKACENAAKLGYQNVSFHLGEIEQMPVVDKVADVVISNCVLNLLPSKDKIFKEIFRVLKYGGRFCISDVVLTGELPAKLKEAAEMYFGCVSGAIQKDDYLKEISNAKLINVKIEKETPIVIPDDVLLKFMQPDELKRFKDSNVKILSITVTGEKCKCGTC